MKIKGWDLKYFNSGEWQVVDERLKDLEKANNIVHHDGYNPGRKSLFGALRAVPSGAVRVAFIGQDPYPDLKYATGSAFSCPGQIPPEEFPQTLRTIFKEYSSDLHYELPSSGDLSKWERMGVLLWNAIPTCRSGRSLSHDWDEWSYLTREILELLSRQGIVFVFLGGVARRYVKYVSTENNVVIETSHPSPLGSANKNTKNPFMGSRIFSTINGHLVSQALPPIDWKLP